MANEKRWYVHDEHDCFMDFEFEEWDKAMELAADMERDDDYSGVHVVCMTQAQHEKYCERGDLRAAFRVK